MPRLGLGIGINLPRPIWFGGSSPVFPTAGNVGYYSAEDISNLGFSSANSVNFIDDQSSASNDLTQGTASANPLFIEHDTVTQFTLANQPTLKYDKEVSQDTSANQPTLVDVGGGELAMEFDSDDFLIGIPPQSNSYSYALEGYKVNNLSTSKISLNTGTGTFIRIGDTLNRINVRVRKTSDDGLLDLFFNHTIDNGVYDYRFDFDGTDLELYIDDILIDSLNLSLYYQLEFIKIGESNSSLDASFKALSIYSSADSSGTPDFELLPDPSTMRKDDGTQPIAGDQIQGWHATGAELAMGFDDSSDKVLEGIQSSLGDFNYELDLDIKDTTNKIYLNSDKLGTTDTYRLFINPTNTWSMRTDDGVTNEFGLATTGRKKVRLKRDGTTFSLFINDIQLGLDYTSSASFPVTTIGRGQAASPTTDIYSFKQWNSADSSGTPDFELIPSEESCNVLAGQQVSRWNSTTHKPWLNRLLSDGNDDHLEGMAVQTGDFTYMFKLAFNALSTTEYIFSHTTGLSAVVLLSDNYIYLRDTTGANDIGLTGHTVELGEHVYTITREGDSLKYYVDSCLKETVDVTGRTFELDTFGRPTDSLADLTADWGVWNRALTKEELDYFSYLRSEDTNNILLPPLTPTCP